MPSIPSGAATTNRMLTDNDVTDVNILLVDDEPKNLTVLESLLAEEGRRLVFASSGAQALKHLLQNDFAVVLLDVHMPGMDGFETAEMIRGRERSRHTPIIFLTAAITGDSHMARGYSLGAVDYLVKPLDPVTLRSKVAVFIELFRKTEQVRHQAQALAETTALLNSVLEGARGFGIIALDIKGDVIFWNEGARRIYGYEASEVVGRANLAMLHIEQAELPESAFTLLDSVSRDGKSVGDLEAVSKSGRRVDVAMTLERRTSLEGEVIGYVAIAQDITAQRDAERQAIRLLEERAARAEAERARDRLQQVLDVLPEGVLVANSDGQVSAWNAAATALLGRAPLKADAWAAGTMGSIDQLGEVCPVERLPLVRSVRNGEIVHGEQLMLKGRAQGAPVPVLLNSAPLRDPDGSIIGGVLVFQEISAIKDLERQKDEFLAAASHDLKNPLAIVKARAQFLMRQAERVGTQESMSMIEGLRGIDLATRRLVGMVNELLDVARLQMDRPLELERALIDLTRLVRDTSGQLQASTDRHEIIVECGIAQLPGFWDRDRMERVLVNLLTNAIKYSPNGGKIVIELAEESDGVRDWAVLRVRDPGIGIPPEDLPRIFDRFYRGTNVVGHIDGAGIGLSGVQFITEKHGGEVSVESALGSGSTFSVRVPVNPQDSEAMIPTSRRP